MIFVKIKMMKIVYTIISILFFCCKSTILTYGKCLPDTVAPRVDSVVCFNNQKVYLYFNEPISSLGADDLTHYLRQPDGVRPSIARRDSLQSNRVELVFTDTLLYRTTYQMCLQGIIDFYGNTIADTCVKMFRYYSERNDVLIQEIMADPDPVVGLPNEEWIELKNTSSFTINLLGWRIVKSNSRSGPLPKIMLEPDSILLICGSGSLSSLVGFGNVKSVSSFPALSNAGDLISLIDAKGKTIHAVAYRDSWHENPLKKNGGWSLEMIDPKNPCGGAEN